MKHSFHSSCTENFTQKKKKIRYSHLGKLKPAYSKIHTKIINPALKNQNSSTWPIYTEVKKSQPTKKPPLFTSMDIILLAQKSRKFKYYEKRISNEFLFYRVLHILLLMLSRLYLSSLPVSLEKPHQIRQQNV